MVGGISTSTGVASGEGASGNAVDEEPVVVETWALSFVTRVDASEGKEMATLGGESVTNSVSNTVDRTSHVDYLRAWAASGPRRRQQENGRGSTMMGERMNVEEVVSERCEAKDMTCSYKLRGVFGSHSRLA